MANAQQKNKRTATMQSNGRKFKNLIGGKWVAAAQRQDL